MASEVRVLLAALVLLPLVWGAALHHPPLFRWGYDVPVYRRGGQTWR